VVPEQLASLEYLELQDRKVRRDRRVPRDRRVQLVQLEPRDLRVHPDLQVRPDRLDILEQQEAADHLETKD